MAAAHLLEKGYRRICCVVVSGGWFIEWVRTLQRPVALVLMDDWDAPMLIELCREAGYEVPRDLVMITTGCHSEVLPLCRVSLSAVQKDQELQARLAVGCLDVLIPHSASRRSLSNVAWPTDGG